MTKTLDPHPSKLADAMMIVFGLIMMITPLALWVAWSDLMLFTILAAGLISAGAYWAIYRATHASSQPTDPAAALPRRLSEDAMRELHGGWPWYCHHTTDGTARFRKTMNRFADLTGTARRY